MCSGISFLIGIVFLIKGSYRISNRNVPAQMGRIIGAILMAPLVVGFTYGLFVVNQAGGLSQEVLLDETLLNAACVEMGALIVAITLAGYLILSLPVEPLPEAGPGWSYGRAPVSAMPSKVMTTAEVATYLRIPEFEVIALIEEGKLPAARIGSEYRIARSAVDDFLASDGLSET